MIKLKDILKESSGFYPTDPGPKRWFKPYGDKYTEYEKATNKELKEFRPPGKITGEPADEQGLSEERIIADMKEITGQHVSVSRKDTWFWRIQFRYTKREIPAGVWNEAIKHIETVYDAEIDKDKTLNDYEKNWEPEEPPEWVPTIYFEVL